MKITCVVNRVWEEEYVIEIDNTMVNEINEWIATFKVRKRVSIKDLEDMFDGVPNPKMDEPLYEGTAEGRTLGMLVGRMIERLLIRSRPQVKLIDSFYSDIVVYREPRSTKK